MGQWVASLDMYRKVPVDLLEGTKRGSILSYGAILVMVTLFILETRAYFTTNWVSNLVLDDNDESRVMVNFNITMMDLRCEWAVVDTVSVLGTDQNITAHISKWNLDGGGIRKSYHGRNKNQKDIVLYDEDVTETHEELLENGEQAVILDYDTFQYAKNEFEYLFVDFFASWCSHCRDLAPTWETLAEVMDETAANLVIEMLEDEDEETLHKFTKEDFEHAKKAEHPVIIAKADCVVNQKLCQENRIMAYPTLRLYVDGEHVDDYRGHRTVIEMADWLVQKEGKHEKETETSDSAATIAAQAARRRMEVEGDEAEWFNEIKHKHHRGKHNRNDNWDESEHPGCQIVGSLMIDRVPGNFHIQARSNQHDLVPHMTNVSHIVHELSIGDPLTRRMITGGKVELPKVVKDKFSPMDSNSYVTHEYHQAYHHYLKVVTTDIEGLKSYRGRQLKAYQIIYNSQRALYENNKVPEAKFIYDLTPIAVNYKKEGRHWYDYLTSLMAIIGGTFTVVGMMESGINAAVAKRRRR
mmetsp:Transcript_37585/g.41515  ORF Transcript_37585/g.41515 Transcript_37585/m.41515 type:complete len:525 (-) Transcript_37585:44-1618(-)